MGNFFLSFLYIWIIFLVNIFRLSYSKIMANFEAFLWKILLSTNPEILKYEILFIVKYFYFILVIVLYISAEIGKLNMNAVHLLLICAGTFEGLWSLLVFGICLLFHDTALALMVLPNGATKRKDVLGKNVTGKKCLTKICILGKNVVGNNVTRK